MAGGSGMESGEFGLQIAPMLDVMFVLLLFFMVMAGLQKTEAELNMDLPVHGATQNFDKPPVPIYLKINDQHQIYFNNIPLDTPTSRELPNLKKRLQKIVQQFGTKNPVILNPDLSVPHQRIVDVMNACSSANVKNLSFEKL